MNNKNHTLDAISKVTVIIPLIILVFALVIRADQFKTKKENVTTSVNPSIILSTTPIPIPSPNSFQSNMEPLPISKKISLEGPLYCTFADSEIDVKVSILKKNIHVDYEGAENKFTLLINDDCGYRIDKLKINEPIKICGLGQYRELLNTFNMSDMVSLDTIMSFVPMFVPKGTIENINIQSLGNTCIEQKVEESLFVVPPRVKFVEKTLEEIILEAFKS